MRLDSALPKHPHPTRSSLFLIPDRPKAPAGPLVRWHLLSLDAPSVAACWALFVGWVANVRLAWVDPLAMFLAVWILYAADRLLDAQPLFTTPLGPELKERHHFHHRHRTTLLCSIALLSPLLALLLHFTDTRVLHLYVLLACLLAAWLLLVHARPAPSSSAHRLPKELAVGIFFPAATFIPTVARAPQLRMELLLPALAFGLVCTLNCLFLYAWEHPHAAQRDNAHSSTQWCARYLVPLCASAAAALLVLASVISGSVSWLRVVWLPGVNPLPHLSTLFLASGLSCLLLLSLHLLGPRLHPQRQRALADLVLLSPLLLAPLAHWMALR